MVQDMTERHMIIQRAPNAADLIKRITAAQQRHRQLFEGGKIRDERAPRPEDKPSLSWPEVVIRAADRLRLADMPVCALRRFRRLLGPNGGS
jgi:hypothetical protein